MSWVIICFISISFTACANKDMKNSSENNVSKIDLESDTSYVEQNLDKSISEFCTECLYDNKAFNALDFKSISNVFEVKDIKYMNTNGDKDTYGAFIYYEGKVAGEILFNCSGNILSPNLETAEIVIVRINVDYDDYEKGKFNFTGISLGESNNNDIYKIFGQIADDHYSYHFLDGRLMISYDNDIFRGILIVVIQ